MILETHQTIVENEIIFMKLSMFTLYIRVLYTSYNINQMNCINKIYL